MDQSQNDKFVKPKVEADKDENEKVIVPSQDHPSTSVDPAAKDPAPPHTPSGTKKRKLKVMSDPPMKKKCRNSEVKTEFKEEPSEVAREKEAIVNESEASRKAIVNEVEALRKENTRLQLDILDQYDQYIQHIQQSKIGMQEFDL